MILNYFVSKGFWYFFYKDDQKEIQRFIIWQTNKSEKINITWIMASEPIRSAEAKIQKFFSQPLPNPFKVTHPNILSCWDISHAVWKRDVFFHLNSSKYTSVQCTPALTQKKLQTSGIRKGLTFEELKYWRITLRESLGLNPQGIKVLKFNPEGNTRVEPEWFLGVVSYKSEVIFLRGLKLQPITIPWDYMFQKGQRCSGKALKMGTYSNPSQTM